MDKPTTPNGPNASPWPEQAGSEQGFGATGVFQTVTPPAAEPAGDGLEALFSGFRAPEAPKPAPPPQPKPPAEPVIHKVVFGAGAESSPDLLDRMRQSSAERASTAEKAPAAPPAAPGSGGFTELLRTLGSDSAPPAPSVPPVPAPQRPAQPSGFTSLLKTLDEPAVEPSPAAPSIKTPTPAAWSIPEGPRQAPSASGSGGFTELLRTTTAGEAAPVETKAFAGAAAPTPAPVENKPGAFTQLFGTLGGNEASAPPTKPSDLGGADSSRGSAGSFTRMLSLEPQPPAAAPSFQEERKPLPGSVNYGLSPGVSGPPAVSHDPFAPAPPLEAAPVETTPPSSGFGITRLIQMLDEPTKPTAPRVEPAPAAQPAGNQPGVWTQTFASLSTPSEPAPPVAKAPAWSTPPPLSVVVPPVAPPAAAAGPSEFTRILDASRMRELAMHGGSGAASIPQAPMPPAPAPPAMPSFPPLPAAQIPAAPPMPGMQGIGAMPPSGLYPPMPSQPPAFPINYAPPAAAMPVMPGSIPQPPGMYAPAPPPMPAVSSPPVAKPPATGMGKLVPVLLIVLIVLAVAILLVLLLKH